VHLAWNRATPCVIGLPRFVCVFQTRLGYLGSETTLAKLLPVGFGLLAFICRDALEAFARSAPFPRVVLDCIEQRHSLGALIRLGRRSAVHQGHHAPVGEAVNEAPYAFPPCATPSPPPLPGGKSAVHGAQLPVNPATFFVNTQNPGWHRSPDSIGLPALPPALRSAF